MEANPLWLQVNSGADQEKVLDALVPDFRDPRKKDFLVLRSANYSISEALDAVGASSVEYNLWKQHDKVFEKWAVDHSWELMHDIGREVLLARFKRCVFLQLSIDTVVLAKKAAGDELTPDEMVDSRAAANRYNAASIATLLKVMDPSIGEERPPERPVNVNLKVDVGLADIEQYEQRKLQARALLRQFKNKAMSSKDSAIEGEFQVQE